MLVATMTIGVLGIIMNAMIDPQSLFERMLSFNASFLSFAIGVAIAGLIFRRRRLQLIASAVILIAALHSMLVSTNLAAVLFMPWLAAVEAEFYPATIVLCIVTSVMLALNPAHPIQRVWLRVSSAIVILFALVMLALHAVPDGFMLLGPHPDVTGV